MDEQNQRNKAQEPAAADGSGEEQFTVPPQGDGENETAGYQLRPLIQRVLAWTGIVYVVLLSLLLMAFLALGDYLQGIGRLMTIPLLVACGVYLALSYRSGAQKGGLAKLLVCEAALLYLIGSGLAAGVPVLMAQLG